MAHEHDIYMMLADTAAQRREVAALLQYVPRLEELAVRDGHRLYLAIAERAMGVASRLTGEHKEAESRLNHALELFAGLGSRWQSGRTLVELGELEMSRKNSLAARDYFTRALREFEALGAAPDALRTKERLALQTAT